MGAWGITAFESDNGMEAVYLIRNQLPKDGNLDLGKIFEDMKKDDWIVPDTKLGSSHTGPMVMAEIICKFLDKDIRGLDHHDDFFAKENKFHDLQTFTADKESIRWLRDYLSDTLDHAKQNAVVRAQTGQDDHDQWNGWFKEEYWQQWQDHMTNLTTRLDTLLTTSDNQIELIAPQDPHIDFEFELQR